MFSGCGVGVEPRTPQNLTRISSRDALIGSLTESVVPVISIAESRKHHALGYVELRKVLTILGISSILVIVGTPTR